MSDIVERLREWTRIAVCAEAADEIERLRAGHEDIVEWAKAYPLAIFPEPDLKKAAALLKAGGINLDAVSATAMRHVITQVAKISRRALDGEKG